LDRKTGLLKIRPQHHVYQGHSSHVTNSSFTFDDSYLVTVGGSDLTMFSWKITYPEKPKFFLNAAFIKLFNEELEKEEKEQGDDFDLASEASVMKRAKSTMGGTFTSEVASETTRTNSPQKGLPGTVTGNSGMLPAALCYMCQFKYADLTQDKCPRCFAPRKEPSKQIIRQHTKKFSMKKTIARYNLPTSSFAKATKAQQEMRVRVEEKLKTQAVWMPSLVPRKIPVPPEDSSDSDEDVIRRHIVKQRKDQASQQEPDAASNKSIKPVIVAKKKTAGPDFSDF